MFGQSGFTVEQEAQTFERAVSIHAGTLTRARRSAHFPLLD